MNVSKESPFRQAGDESLRLLGAEAFLKRLDALTGEIGGVRKAEDIECLHRMRVASRRLRAAMGIFADCFPGKRPRTWQTEVRRITRVLGLARDKDVQIEFVEGFLAGLREPTYRPGIARLVLRLRQERERLQGRILKGLDRLEVSGVTAEMGRVLRRVQVHSRLKHVPGSSPAVFQRACQAISTRLEDLLVYEPFTHQPQCKAEHHAMRIAAKRLRYAMEILQPLCEDDLKEPIRFARELQTVLGRIHDCDVWVEQLPQFLEEERRRIVEHLGHTRSFKRLTRGILHLRENRRRRRGRLFRDFSGFWGRTQDEGVWQGLVAALDARLERPEAVLPQSLPAGDQGEGV